MIREYPLWIAVVLPWIAALLVLVGTRPLLGLLGARRTFAIAHYVGLGATALGLLFLGQAIPHLLVADDPRALGDALETEWLHILVLGSTSIDTTLIGDRLAIGASVLIGAGFALARLFIGGLAGLHELELPELAALAQASPDDDEPEIPADRAKRALRRLALIGVLEGAALLVVLASDLAVAALGWAVIGLGSALAVARTLDDERRASLASRVLAFGLIGDLALFGLMALLVAGGIGLNHTQLWLPATGDRLFATELTGVPLTEVLALLLIVAVGARMASLVRIANSIAEALIDAVVVAVPAVYLLVRHHRILGLAPSVLALVLIAGALLATLGVGVALIRPGRAEARRSERPIGEQALAWTGLAWFGLILLAVGVGAWRSAVLLLLAHVLGRLGLRLALLTAEPGVRLPTITGRLTRVLTVAVAGVVPGLGFVALARLAIELLARNSLLGPWFGGLAGLLVVVVAGAYAAALGRLWYQRAVDPAIAPAITSAGDPASDEEDGLDFAPAALALLGLVVLGAMALAESLGLAAGPTTWLDLSLPLAGGHPDVPLQVRESFRDPLGDVGRSWKLGALVLVGVTTGFGWLWARDQFRRGDGVDLVRLATTVEQVFGWGRRSIAALGSLFVGLTELAARGIGRGLYEQGPKVIGSLARDVRAGVGPKLRRRGLWIGGARAGVLGLAIGLMYVLGWLFFKPSVITPGPVEPYGFGGLAPRLIRAGASERRTQDDPPVSDPASLVPVDEPPKPLTDPRVPTIPEVRR